jgi:Family of unknown function (DUF5681)
LLAASPPLLKGLTMTDDQAGYVVGYKRPPKHTRFRPGQSGNSKGRQKNSRNFKTDLMDELREMIVIRENGRERKISKQRAFIKALVAAAIKSDVRAINAVVACTRNFSVNTEDERPEEVDTEDLDILEAFVTRERKRRDPGESKSKSTKTRQIKK